MNRVLLILSSTLAAAGLAFAAPPAPKAASPTAADPVDVFAVGDLAQCKGSTPAGSATARVAKLVEGSQAPVLLVGDLAYEDGTAQEFLGCFDPVWGRFRPRMLPAPGNHEYHKPEAPYFYDYFRQVRGLRQGYYARQMGAWRVIALNSSIDVSEGSPQERWLRDELATHPSRCTLAFWHHPRFSSGKHGPTADMDAIWRDLYQAGVELVVSGHDHDYERFAPQDANGGLDPARGIRQFVVGTGGAKLRKFTTVAANSEARSADSFGVLRLTLSEGGYAWTFAPADGVGFRDQGQGSCH